MQQRRRRVFRTHQQSPLIVPYLKLERLFVRVAARFFRCFDQGEACRLGLRRPCDRISVMSRQQQLGGLRKLAIHQFTRFVQRLVIAGNSGDAPDQEGCARDHQQQSAAQRVEADHGVSPTT